MSKVLVVEDDANLQATLKYNLSKEGYEVFSAGDGAEAVDVARLQTPDVIILDIMLPKISGLEVCRILRREMNVPILFLTAKTDETDKIVGLEIGADDYMTKPFSVRELMARVRAMLRRAGMNEPKAVTEQGLIKIGEIEIDINRHVVTVRSSPVDLTPKEYEVLIFLAKNKGFVFSREQLLEKVWGYDFAGDTRTVDVHIRWLRQKIEATPANPRYLQTVRGAGYKLEG